ncbi:MAG: ComEA family DNA-binding protein [Chitinophagales bacterium]
MNWQQFVKDYFTFTRKERVGLLIVVTLIAGIWISPKIIFPGKVNAVRADTGWIAAAKNLQHETGNSQNRSKENDEDFHEFVHAKSATGQVSYTKNELFYFDPNTLSLDGWKKLGIREKTIATIQKYLSKGGHFYKAEDLKKIYGIRDTEYARLESYIKIEMINNKPNNQSINEVKKDLSPNKPKYNPVDINTADTSAFIDLPGIGSKLASRIISFREKLGGFYAIDQVGETYGLPDSTFQKIKSYLRIETTSIKKINMNTATKDEMKSHPYIKWTLANAIVEYRDQHGNFSSLDDLKKISLITEDVFNKIKFYLTL